MLFSGAAFSLTLDEAVRLAEKNDLRARAQYFRYLSAEESFKAQISKRFGQVGLFWSYTQYETPRIVAPITPADLLTSGLPKDDQVRVYGVQYSVRLFDGCQQYFLIRAKGKEAKLSLTDYEESLARARENAKELYFQILSLKAKRSALLERKKAVEELLRIVENSYRLGKKSLLDLLSVKAELRSVEAQIAEMDSQIEGAKRKLATLIGAKDTSFEVEFVEVKPKRINPDSLLSELLKNNFDLRRSAVQREITEYYKRAAIADFSPKVDFTYARQKFVYASEGRYDWQYTLTASLPIFDFGLRFFNYRRAKAEERRAEALREMTLRATLNDFYALVKELNDYLRVIEATAERVRFTKKAYEIERKKYLLGKSDVYNLLKAEALYFEALGDYRASIYLWAVKKARLDLMLGR